MRKIASSAIVGVYAFLAAPLYAQTEPQVAIDVSLGGGYESNPFLLEGGGSAASASITVRPVLLFEDERGRSQIDGSLRLSQYTNRYDTDIAALIGASTDQQVDERTSIRVAASLQSLRSAVQQALLLDSLQTPIGSEPIPEVPYIDTTIAGVPTRTTSVRSSAGVTHALSELSQLSAGFEFAAAHFEDDAGFDYRDYSGQLSYGRTINERLTLSAGMQGGYVDYVGRKTGDSMILSPNVAVRAQLTSRVDLSASAGVSFVNTKSAVGPDSNRTAFSGSFGICDRGQNSALCLSASRSAQPTALGGVSTVSTVAATGSFKLSEIDQLSVSARYGRTDEALGGSFAPVARDTEIVSASLNYSRELNDRLILTVTPSYTKVFDSTINRTANYGVTVGVTMRFGKRR